MWYVIIHTDALHYRNEKIYEFTNRDGKPAVGVTIMLKYTT